MLIAGATTTDLFYGPDHELYKQVSGRGTTYKLAGGVYKVTVNGSTTTQKSYVDGVILNTRTLVTATTQKGTYGFVKNSSVFFNSTTNNAVVLDKAGNFVTGFRLSPGTTQFENYIKNGALR